MNVPFSIVQNDIVRMKADAIVNTANPEPVIGRGTDAAIYDAAGPRLLNARRQIGRIMPGCCAVTPAYALSASYVIHAVGPVWQGGEQDEPALLRRCYDRALALASDLGCRSIAFPLISTGFYGFPKDLALEIAVSAFRAFLTGSDMQIFLVVWDRASVRLSEQLQENVKKYVDENYVERKTREEYASSPKLSIRPRKRPTLPAGPGKTSSAPGAASGFAPITAPCAAPCDAAMAEASDDTSLRDLLRQTDAGFSETLLRLIDESGKKDAEIYRRANLTRQHFSKIRSNPAYRPTKATALALAIALELDLDQTKDLIGRAGYALTNSSKFDVIITYFIRQRRYDIFEINTALYEYDQLTLGAS